MPPSLSEYPPIYFLRFALIYFNKGDMRRAEMCCKRSIRMISLIESKKHDLASKTRIVQFWMNTERKIYELSIQDPDRTCNQAI